MATAARLQLMVQGGHGSSARLSKVVSVPTQNVLTGSPMQSHAVPCNLIQSHVIPHCGTQDTSRADMELGREEALALAQAEGLELKPSSSSKRQLH